MLLLHRGADMISATLILQAGYPRDAAAEVGPRQIGNWPLGDVSRIDRLRVHPRLQGNGAANRIGAWLPQWVSLALATGGSPGPCFRAMRSSTHSASLPCADTNVDRRGLVQLQTCG